MNILVACEESQSVTKEFRALGHNAFSCDILDPSGEHLEWHVKDDVLPMLNGNCTFITMDKKQHQVLGGWDMIIAFPPCTDLAVSGARHFERKREDGSQQRSIDFFMEFTKANCRRIAIENPVGIMSSIYRKPDQIINPWQFGESINKKTCLWLKGLPKLEPTNIVDKEEVVIFESGKKMSKWYSDCFKLPKAERSKMRSKTFEGIAKAMANQWGREI